MKVVVYFNCSLRSHSQTEQQQRVHKYQEDLQVVSLYGVVDSSVVRNH